MLICIAKATAENIDLINSRIMSKNYSICQIKTCLAHSVIKQDLSCDLK
jgi:hypothetical protein